MITLKNQMERIISERLTVINGSKTENELNNLIAKDLTSERISGKNSYEHIFGIDNIDNNDIWEIEPNGAWVYAEYSIEDWFFKRYDTISEAVRDAVNMIEAYVICDGEIVEYNTMSDGTAYYIDNRTNIIRVINI